MAPNKLRSVFEEGVFRLSWSLDRRQSLVDLADVAEVAAMVLTDSGTSCRRHVRACRARPIHRHDLGAILSGVLGRVFRLRRLTANTNLESLFGGAGPEQFPHQARVLRAITRRYSSHDFVGNPNVLTWLLGREPTNYEQFVRRHYAAFAAARHRQMDPVARGQPGLKLAQAIRRRYPGQSPHPILMKSAVGAAGRAKRSRLIDPRFGFRE